ncbi:MAG: KpsF/GutQ family sugar-phosphate isomerase [Candidatus Sumerlaeia bacterium]|nr:KpsF/GutQ family sugar-phosphate isomerase [Candidatus Sumerlaeia bacterium]
MPVGIATQPDDWKSEARRVLLAESAALAAAAERIDDSRFVEAVRLLHAASAPVVVSGLGKSGHIAAKVAATLASTGTPAVFLHASEALHGDLGMVVSGSAALLFSQSGATEEVLNLLPFLTAHSVPVVAVTGSAESPLAQGAQVVLESRVDAEACPLNLAPMSSTTLQLAIGDALAAALIRRRGFTAEDFAIRHPLGALGRRLLMKVSDVMRKGADLPAVGEDVTLQEAVDALNKGRLGAVAIIDAERRLVGIFTDGDFRRLWCLRHTIADNVPIREVMVHNPKRVPAELLGVKAVDLMETHKITVLPAVDAEGRLEGMVHLHQLVEAGIAR